jgi:dihydrofolate synthase / folylpolyglutamate synthase
LTYVTHNQSRGYIETLQRLFAARRFGMVMDLSRMHLLLEGVGNPHKALGTVVTVAGTNGKGSTVALLAAAAQAGGIRCAVYTSPHLCTVRERMVVAGELISVSDFVKYSNIVKRAGGDEFTFFEQLTAIALLFFAAAQPTLTVLEVGMGGRLDATNVVDADVSVVTGVALDHQSILGDTVEEIAMQKAGIYKYRRAAVIGASGDPAALPVLRACAHAVGSTPIVEVTPNMVSATPRSSLVGRHQQFNAAAAMAALAQLRLLAKIPFSVLTEDVISRGFLSAMHPGRFELVNSPHIAQPVIIDGAHNVDGAVALSRAVAEFAGVVPRHIAFILAMSADKEVDKMAAALVPVVGCVIATEYRQSRSMPSSQLVQICKQVGFADVHQTQNVEQALRLAAAMPHIKLIVVAGSLFVVGEARAFLLDLPIDPLVVSDPAPISR